MPEPQTPRRFIGFKEIPQVRDHAKIKQWLNITSDYLSKLTRACPSHRVPWGKRGVTESSRAALFSPSTVDTNGLEIVTTNVAGGGVQLCCPEMRYRGMQQGETYRLKKEHRQWPRCGDNNQTN